MPKLIFVNRVCWPAEEATAQLLIDLAEQLTLRGWDCHIVTSSSGPDSKPVKANRQVHLHRVGKPVEGRRLGLMAKAIAYRRFSGGCRKVLQSLIRPGDHVIVMTDPPLIGAKIARLVHKQAGHLWHWTQDIYPEVAVAISDRSLLSNILNRFKAGRNKAWDNATGIVTIGEDMAALIRKEISEPVPVEIIPNWPPLPVAPPVHIDFRQTWGIPAEALLVVYSGNLGRAHILTPILELAEQLRQSSQIRFVFVGSGAQKNALVALTQKRELANVSFHAAVPREELSSLLAAADVHLVTMRPACRGTVLPSKFYGIVAAHRPILFIGPVPSEYADTITSSDLGHACSPDNLAGAVDYLMALATAPSTRPRSHDPVIEFSRSLPSAESAADAWHKILSNSTNQLT